MISIGGEVVLGVVSAVKQVSEGEGRGSGAEEWTGGEVEDLMEGDERVESGDHGVDL